MSNMENTTANKFEGPILKMEPRSMKKKKKGGGYNMRKSIAWNRAFFTEEGVLDPEELSLISGTQVSSSTEEISTLKEAMDSIDEDCEFVDDSANLQELEKHLFRGNPSVRFQENRETGHLPSKHTSPACSSKASTSMASHRVIPKAKRAGVISSASPSPLPSSSLKRPASVNSCKPVSEASKIPVSKPRNLSFLSSIKSNISGAASSMKNQILRPVVNKQRILESKSCKRSVNTPKKKTKEGSDALAVKSSALHAKRSKINPSINLPVPTQCPPQVNKVENSGPKVIQESLHTIKEDLPEHQYKNARPVDSLPSKNVITGRTLQQSKVQSYKPSGLRKPSPSLGFFDQPKASSSNKFTKRDAGSLPRVEALGDKRSPAELPQALNSNVPRANSLVSSLRNDSSFQSNTSNRSSDDLAEAERNGKEILDKREHYVPRSDEQAMHVTCSEDKIFHHDRNGISSEVDRGVVVSEFEKVLVTGPCEDANASDCGPADKTSRKSRGDKDSQLSSQINFEQCYADVEEPRTMVKSPSKEEKSSELAATEHDIAIVQNGAVSNSKVLNSVMSSSPSLSFVSDLHQPPPCLGDDSQTSSDEKYAVPDVYIPVLEKAKYEKLIEYRHSFESGMIEDKIFETEGPSKLEWQGSSYSSEYPCASQSEDSVIRSYGADPLGEEAILRIPVLPLNDNIKERCVHQSSETEDLRNLLAAQVELQADPLGEEAIFQIPVSPLNDNIRENVHQSSETEDLRNLMATQVELQAAFLKVEYGSKNVGRLLIEKDDFSKENPKFKMETSPLVLSDERGKCGIDDSDTFMSDVLNGVKVEEFLTNNNFRLDLPESSSGLAACRNVSSVTYLSGEPSSLNVLSCSSEVSILADSRTCDESKSSGQVEISQTSLILESNVYDEDQRCNLQNAVETDPTLHAHSLIEWEKHCRSPEVLDVMETGNSPTKSGNEGNYSETQDMRRDKYIEGTNDTVEPYQLELPTCSMLDTEVSDDKMKLLPGNCLNEEIAETTRYDKSFASVSGAHNIQYEREPCESELRSSNPISATTSNPEQAIMDDENGSNEVACIEDLRSGCTEIWPRFATNELSSASQLMHDAQSGGSLQRDLTSPDGKCKSIEPIVSTSIDETQPEVYENRDSLVQDTKCDFITCQENDENDTSPIEKSKETSNGRNLTIIPPKNAVPFSDEWLAAVEAAGEEILTMKSGAVQNSPPDKTVPEPSPWSPVKKKNMSIGPYDCTKKFINN